MVKKIGIFLGLETSAGGMFQYAESLLDALAVIQKRSNIDVEVAYVSSTWDQVLKKYPFIKRKLWGGKYSLRIADVLMALCLPGSLTRFIASLLSPLSIQINRFSSELWIFPGQDALSFQVKRPTLSTVHDLMHLYESSFPEVSKNNRKKIREHRFKNLISWAKGVLVDSEVGITHVVESYGVERNKVFPLPYVPPSYIFQPEASGFESRYTLPEKFIFYPAQFWEHKNHKRLISAARSLKVQYPDIKLVFTGGKSKNYQEIKNFIESEGMSDNVLFVGFVPNTDLVGFYRRARAMIMPTFFGPTNIPPLEAFVCGCPVAVSGIYGMPEQVGDAALLFDPKSVEEMALVMEKLWTDDELILKLKARGYDKIKNWGQAQFADRFEKILNRLSDL